MSKILELRLVPTILFLLIASSVIAVLWPFKSAIAWAIIVAILVMPLQRYFENKWHKTWLATILVLLVFTVIILLPAFLIFTSVITEAQQVYANFSGQDFSTWHLPASLTSLPWVGDFLQKTWQHYTQDGDAIKSLFSNMKGMALLNQSTSIIANFFHVLLDIILMYLVLAFLLFNHQKNKKYIDQLCKKYLDKATEYQKIIVNCVHGIGLGFLTIGVGIGVIMTTVYVVIGLPVPLLLGLITAVLSIIPFTLPLYYAVLFVVLLFQGHLAAGVVLLAIGTALNLLSDNWLQPYIIGKKAKIHFLITLFGVLGGLEFFGMLGVFIGPISLAIGQRIFQTHVSKQ